MKTYQHMYLKCIAYIYVSWDVGFTQRVYLSGGEQTSTVRGEPNELNDCTVVNRKQPDSVEMGVPLTMLSKEWHRHAM